MAKRKTTKQSGIVRFIMAVPSIISLFSQVLSVLEYDARESGRSVVALFSFCLLALACLTATWLCFSVLLIVYLLSLNWTLLAALLLVSALNLLLLFFCALMLAKTKRHLFFPVTRQLLRDVIDGA